MEEKRNLPRFNLQFPARIEVLDGDMRSEPEIINLVTHDICSRGAYFETAEPLPEGTGIKIRIFYSFPKSHFSAGASSLIQAEGFVSRSDAEGMAVRFKDNYKIVPLGKD